MQHYLPTLNVWKYDWLFLKASFYISGLRKRILSMLLYVICAVFVIIVIMVKRRLDFIRKVDQIGGPDGDPIIGQLRQIGMLNKDTPELPRMSLFLERLLELMPDYTKSGLIRLWIGSWPHVLVTNFQSAEPFFNSNNLITKAKNYKVLKGWLGTGLLTSTGKKWKIRRKLITPAFHFRILDDFLLVMNEHSKQLVEIFEKTMDKKWIDIVPYITRYTLDVICETAMGISSNIQKNQDLLYQKHLHIVSERTSERSFYPWLWWDALYNITPWGKEYNSSLKYIQDFTLKVIKERKDSFFSEKSDKKNDDAEDSISFKKRKRQVFLDTLLDQHLNDPSFGIEDIREEVDTFMFEGHDTTSMGLSWTMYLIGLYPDVQKKIVDELDAIFGEDLEKPVTNEDLKEMKYLECVIKESHRLYPPVPYIGRAVTEDVVVNGTTIPKGVVAVFFILGIHRDPEVYPNPEDFNPDNFLPENTSGRHPFAFVPFSAGPRNCVGQRFAMMEEKTTLAYVLRNFTIESLDPRSSLRMKSDLVLRPVGGVRMSFKRRK